MQFTQYYVDCLSQASYLVGDEASGRAVVVDPRRDVSEYLDDAKARGLAGAEEKKAPAPANKARTAKNKKG